MDASVIRLVVISLGAVCLFCTAGIIFIAALGHEPPPTLGSVLGMSVGALVGILVTPGRFPPLPPSPNGGKS